MLIHCMGGLWLLRYKTLEEEHNDLLVMLAEDGADGDGGADE